VISFAPGHVILVTGASSGIGRASALLCNALGATVIACGRNARGLEEAGAASARPEAFFREARDLTDDMDALPSWIAALREKYGKLRGLFCCAGHARLMPLRDYSRVEAQELFDIHFHAPLLLTKGFADRRNNAGPGSSVLFMGSAAVIAKESALSAYGGAKAALLTAMRSLARETAARRIRVNALAPAVVRTPMGDAYLSFLDDDARQKETEAYPLGLGEPEDVARMAAFLLSDAGRWITGQTIILDGGRY
jgi:NAD(P)-dependent dehydrogenase (short-subunit alcohol dehydrogenase family)